MRWLIVHPGPNFSVADVHDGWLEALTLLGEEVAEFNLDRRLTFYDTALVETGVIDKETGHPGIRKAVTREQAIEFAANGILSACYQVWPDVVFLISAFFIPPWMLEVVRARRHKVVMLFTESPYQDTQQLQIAELADVALLNDPVNLAAYQKVAPAARYMPHAYRPNLHYPAAPGTVPTCDFAFVGTGFPSRVRFFEQMDLTGLSAKLAGPWLELPAESPLRDYCDRDPDNCIDNADTAELYRHARCGLNLYRQEAEQDHVGEGWAMGPRELEMAACGLFYVRDPRPEGDEVLPMLPRFGSPGEAGELVRWWLAHDDQRHAAAQQAREAIADRTFLNNAKTLISMIAKG